MLEIPRRKQRITVALPASLTIDVPHLREKTTRIGMIARALAIFRVEEVVIYQDKESGKALEEGRFLEKILRFAETPQYLRRHFFKMDPELQFTGALPPLRSPHHPDREEPRPGQLREGAVISSGAGSEVDAGYKRLVSVKTQLERSTRITVRMTKVFPALEGEQVDPSGLHIYWGFRVSRENRTLGEVIRKGDQDLTISTSRKGTEIREVMEKLRARWEATRRALVLFGSPREGVTDIVLRSHARISDLDFNINTIPDQGVETVRTEEAVMSTLAVLNTLGEA